MAERGSSIRNMALWSGVATTSLLCIVYIVSMLMMVVHWSDPRPDRSQLSFGVQSGSAGVSRVTLVPPIPPGWHAVEARAPVHWWIYRDTFESDYTFSVPLWPALLFVGVPTVWCWWRSRRRSG